MNIKQAKNILLTELLARLNVFPAKISGDLAMYFAINREEIVPSLSVSLKKNTALDFGTGKVYDSISLVQEIKKCSVSEALKIISEMDFSSSFKLNDSLKELGLSSAFLPSANFSNMIEGPSWIGTVNQNTRITLDEEGVTASAFTQIDYNGSAMPTDEAKMILDRPFLYAITSGNGCVLFIGCYNRP